MATKSAFRIGPLMIKSKQFFFAQGSATTLRISRLAHACRGRLHLPIVKRCSWGRSTNIISKRCSWGRSTNIISKRCSWCRSFPGRVPTPPVSQAGPPQGGHLHGQPGGHTERHLTCGGSVPTTTRGCSPISLEASGQKTEGSTSRGWWGGLSKQKTKTPNKQTKKQTPAITPTTTPKIWKIGGWITRK